MAAGAFTFRPATVAMPYKEPRVQLNLKITPEDYAALEAEANLADTEVPQYARHLLLQRQAQPLSKGAHHERREARKREASLRKQMDALEEKIRTLEAANADLVQWRQRAHALEMELVQARAELDDPARTTAIIQRLMNEREATEAAKRAAEQAVAASAGTEEPAASPLTSSARRRARRSS